MGAGIGGLASALALKRLGWEVAVHERAPRLAHSGAGLVLAPNAVWALRSLDLADAVGARATALEGSGLRRPDGTWISRVDAEAVAHRTGAPALGVMRSDLVDVLAGALGRELIELGSEITDVSDLATNLVVGADGIGSHVRRSKWPDHPPPRYAGYAAWRALVPHPDPASYVASETWGRGQRFGVVPVGRGQAYLYATASCAEDADHGSSVDELRRRFGRWHAPIPTLLDALDGATVLHHDVYDLHPSLTDLHRSPEQGSTAVVLVGDAAHAMEPNLGQGAGTALEDAVVLAHCLGENADIATAVIRYSRARVPRVAALSRLARRMGRVAQLEQPILVSARDALIALTPDRLARNAAAGAAGWRPPRPTSQEHR